MKRICENVKAELPKDASGHAWRIFERFAQDENFQTR